MRGLRGVLFVAYYIVSVNAPAVFHLTHHKAGSQWIKSILEAAAPDAAMFVPAQRQVAHVVGQRLEPGRIYPTVYLTRQRFEALDLPASRRQFIIIRDLRDTLVSLYFGLKVHHHLFRDDQREVRALLNDRSVEDGLLFLIGERLSKSADIQQSWLGADELTVRYEDLLREPIDLFARIFAHCEIAIEPERLRELVSQRDFRNVANRNPGEENVRSHQRKGIAGDWRTHFTDRIKDTFKQRFGQLLISTGYERDMDW